MGTPDHPNKLSETFAATPFSSHVEKWNDLWAESFTPWDRGGPSLALHDLLAEHPDLFPASPSGRKRTALVPGSGQGHDVLLLASFGYDVYGLDASAAARERAIRNQAATESNPLYQPREGVQKGNITWLVGDFFAGDWLRESGVEDGLFDLIFDYTFLCALPLEVRPQWAQRMASLLRPTTGRLVCLEFPTGKPATEAGPPWGVQPETYLALLGRPGTAVSYDADGRVVHDPDTPRSPDGLQRLSFIRPRRTHPAGMDDEGRVVDGLSVWSRP